MRYAYGLLLLFAVGIVQAATVTLDFEEFTVGDSGALLSQGYSIDGAVSAGEIVTAPFPNSSNAYQSSDYSYDPGKYIAGVSITRVDGNAFALWSADWWFTGSYGEFDLNPFSFVGATLSNGDNIYAYSAAELGQGDWLNIVGVTFFGDTANGGYPIDGALMSVDNIVVGAAVPVPAAVWLFGSALAGLGWLRSKQTD